MLLDCPCPGGLCGVPMVLFGWFRWWRVCKGNNQPPYKLKIDVQVHTKDNSAVRIKVPVHPGMPFRVLYGILDSILVDKTMYPAGCFSMAARQR